MADYMLIGMASRVMPELVGSYRVASELRGASQGISRLREGLPVATCPGCQVSNMKRKRPNKVGSNFSPNLSTPDQVYADHAEIKSQ